MLNIAGAIAHHKIISEKMRD